MHDDTAPPSAQLEERTITLHRAAGELEFVACRLGGAWLFSWSWRGRLLLGVEPYVAGSEEEN